MNLQDLIIVNVVDTPGTGSGEHVSARSASFDGVDGLLSNTDPTDLHTTNTDSIIIGMWVNITDFTNGPGVLSKTDSLTGGTAFFVTSSPDGSLTGKFRNRALGGTSVDSSIGLSGSNFVVFWIDPNAATPLKGCELNGVNVASVAYGGSTVFASIGGTLSFGTDGFSDPMLGRIDEAFICLNPADFAAALSVINSSIYNSGAGKLYANVSSGNKTTMGLAHWWGFDEATGTRKDLHGTDDLTASGSVTAGTAIVAS